MPNFDTYVARHGEHWIQSIIEQIERIEGIYTQAGISLEDRWQTLMQNDFGLHQAAA